MSHRCLKRKAGLAAVVLALAAIASVASADEIPRFWRKSMVNDPALNYPLKKYTADLKDAPSTAFRNSLLARMEGAWCKGSTFNKKLLKEYLSNWSNITVNEGNSAAFEAESSLRQFSYFDLAHLCSAIEYQFGPKGKLIPGAVTLGVGVPKTEYSQQNSYIRVASVFKQ